MWKADLAMVTLQDCLDMKRCKNQSTIIENGQVVGFTEEVPDQSGNSGQAQ